MEEQRFNVFILPDGTVKIEAQGFTGAACELATKALEDALGKVIADQRTGEFYAEERAKVSQ